jgi:hypothetical protein
MKSYRAYRFTGADPAIAEVRAIIGKDMSLKEVEKDGGPTAGTMRNWFKGKTKRPQNCTLEAAGRALGYERVWRRRNGKGE